MTAKVTAEALLQALDESACPQKTVDWILARAVSLTPAIDVRMPIASSACPMDGINTPHAHGVQAVVDYLAREAKRFAPFEYDKISITLHGWEAMTHMVVPKEPTPEMVEAVMAQPYLPGRTAYDRVRIHYQAMLAAAPEPPL